MVDAVPIGMKSVPKQMLWKLIGEDDAKLLGVRLDKVERIEQGIAAAILHVAEHLYDELLTKPPIRQLAELLFHAIVRNVWDMKKGWNRETFALPPSLEKSWRVQKAPAA